MLMSLHYHATLMPSRNGFSLLSICPLGVVGSTVHPQKGSLFFFLLREAELSGHSQRRLNMSIKIRQTHIVITAAPGRTIEYDTQERMYDIFVDVGNGNTSCTDSGKT